MRDEFFGDINDYRKYGLLRELVGDGDLRLGVCWMRTRNRKFAYLDSPGEWERYDPKLYSELQNSCKERGRWGVKRVEQSGLLACAVFYGYLVPHRAADRKNYFEEMLNEFRNVDLIFFDPDNGLEIDGKSGGANPSPRYLYYCEVREAFKRSHSLLIYQHLPRLARDKVIKQRASKVSESTGGAQVHWILTPDVLFLLVMQREHVGVLLPRVERFLGGEWSRQIKGYGAYPSH
jgi:hypothetical protein